jgi:hypothetical protein
LLAVLNMSQLDGDCLLMMEAVSTSEASVNFYETARRYIPEDSHLHTHRLENLKPHVLQVVVITIFNNTILFCGRNCYLNTYTVYINLLERFSKPRTASKFVIDDGPI